MNTSINTTNTATKIYSIAKTTDISDISDPIDNLVQFPLSDKMVSTQAKNTNRSKTHKQSKTVQPMKDIEDIERAKGYFHDTPSRYNAIHIRNYCLFILGINVARRIGDLLGMKINEVIDEKGRFSYDGWIEITEQKTGKPATFQLHPYVQEAIREYLNTLKNYNMDDYLFASRKINKEGEYRLDPKSAWRIMNDMSKALELNYNVGTHTMRKTKVYQTIQANKNDPYIVASISNELNHSSVGVTYRYCGFDKEVRSHLYMDNPL